MRKLNHFIITGSYEHDSVPSTVLSAAVRNELEKSFRDPAKIWSYTSSYFWHPMELCLRDVWCTLTADELAAIPARLRYSIQVLLTGLEGKEYDNNDDITAK